MDIWKLNPISEVKTIYKYRAFDDKGFHLKTISNQEFYFARRDQLNDPFDMNHNIFTEEDYLGMMDDFFQEMRNQYLNKQISLPPQSVRLLFSLDKNVLPIFAKSVTDRSRNYEIGNVRICSFTMENWKNNLMWAHYSKEHTGFCIGLDFQNILAINKLNKSPRIIPLIADYIKNYDIFSDLDRNKIEFFILYLKAKFFDWKFENEIRLSCLDFDRNKELSVQYPIECFSEIILGLKVSPNKKKEIIEILNSKPKKIKLYQIKPPLPYSMELTREEINY